MQRIFYQTLTSHNRTLCSPCSLCLSRPWPWIPQSVGTLPMFPRSWNFSPQNSQPPHRCFGTDNFNGIESIPFSKIGHSVSQTITTASWKQKRTQTLKQDLFLSPAQKFDELIGTLGSEIRRRKRVNRRTIQAILELLNSQGSEILGNTDNSDNASFLLGCTTSLLPQMSPEERSNVSNTIWKCLETSKSPKNLEILNILLRSYVYNEYRDFEPLELYQSFPIPQTAATNSKTFYYILLAYCQRGDLDMAQKVLEILNQKSVPVTEEYFNALILGNGRAGDWDGAKKILELMKNASVFPSTKTYLTLLQVFVESKDKYNDQDFMQLYYRAAAEVRFTDLDLLTLTKRILAAENYSAFYKILDWIFVPSSGNHDSRTSLSSSFTQDESQLDIFNSIISIIWTGFSKEAFLLFSKWILKDPSAERNYSSGFIKEVINAKTDFPKIEYIFKKSKNPIAALLSSAEFSLKSSQFELAISLFHKMKEHKLPIRPHYFWPIFIHAKSNEVLQTIEHMKSLGIVPDVETLVDYIIPKFEAECEPNRSGGAIEILQLLYQKAGLSLSAGLLKAMLMYLLRPQRQRLEEASKICETFRGTLAQPNSILELLFQNLNTQNLHLAIPILKSISRDKSSEDKTDYVGKFVIRLMDSVGSGVDCDFKNFLDGLAIEKVSISQEALGIISHKACSNLFQLGKLEIETKLKLENGNSSNQRSPAYVHPKEMDLQSLESHLIELKSKGLNPRGTLRKLFIKYCQIHRRSGNNLESILRLKFQFEKEFGQISVGMKSSLLGVWIEQENLKEARLIYDDLKKISVKGEASEGEDLIKLDAFKIIDFSNLLTRKSGNSEEAVQLLKIDIKSEIASIPESKESITRNLVRMLEGFAANDLKHGTSFTNVVLEWLLEEKIATPTNPILGVLVKSYLESGDVKSALNSFISFAQKYRVIPGSAHLGYAVVGSNDPEMLNSYIEACTGAIGATNTLYTLAFIYSDIGELDNSRKIFEKLGKSINTEKLRKQIEFLTRRNEPDKILNLIKILIKIQESCRIKNEELLDILRIPLVQQSSLESSIREILEEFQSDGNIKIPAHLIRSRLGIGKLSSTTPIVAQKLENNS